MLVVETPHLTIRTFVPADAAALLGVFGDAEVMRYSMTGVVDETWVAAFIQRCERNYRERGYGLWGVVEKQSGIVIGYCGLKHYPDIDGSEEVEIGYRLVHSHWGRGYATEAATAVRDHAFGTIGLSRLVALIDPSNVASIRVAEKIGMRHEKDIMIEGYDHPDRLYVIEHRRDVR